MKPYSNITCGILTPLDLSSPQLGAKLLHLLARHSILSPTHIGNSEPVREQYNSLSSGLKSWGDPFLWRNNQTGIAGSVWFGRGLSHSCIYVRVAPKFSHNLAQNEVWSSFLIEACSIFEADFGYVHLTTQDEFADPEIPYECTYAVDTGLTTNDLRRKIPKLSWATYFSGAYKEIVQHLRRFSFPGIIVMEPTNDSICIQFTSSMISILNNYSAFRKIRSAVQNKIEECNIFKDEGDAWKPDFVFDQSGRM